MLDAVILSDLHLGSGNSQVRCLSDFLEGVAAGRPATARLILNGDVFDSFDFRRLSRDHWKVLSLIRKLSAQTEVVWICGNHEGTAEVVSHLLGVTVRNEHVVKSGGRRILVLHGHTFDDFLDAHPVLVWLGDCVYAFLQWIDRTHSIARLAKRGSKTFLRVVAAVEAGAVAYARQKGCGAVCCGHTHFATVSRAGEVEYHNGGCWTETPCTYLSVAAGCVRLHSYDSARGRRSVRAGATAPAHRSQPDTGPTAGVPATARRRRTPV
jgi:UDP-2,3-diacylglucosamine pyrophosphatase LpxH